MDQIETDYLVVGAGASALSFVDTLIDHTDADIVMVDRRDRPGGHWNDAYPFVRLHQPSSYYGVNSRDLGRGTIARDGLNAGFEELASGPEVTAYFHALLDERLIPSGRVRFLPMHDHFEGGEVRKVLSGETLRVVVRRRIVDARLCENRIPVTHRRKFDVAEGVACIPPNDLPRRAAAHDRYTILGAGKTAMDAALWLLMNGADPDRIRWVVPRDSWIVNRAQTQPSAAFFHKSVGAFANQVDALANGATVDEFTDMMESTGAWFRLDPDVRPEIMHGATLSAAELARLRRIGDKVRLGRVDSIHRDRILCRDGARDAAPDALYVDCTASALSHSKTWPTFTDERIGLQMVRLFQPCFSAAMIARIEALDLDDMAKNALARPVPMPDTVPDWIGAQMITSMNQFAWLQVSELKDWINASRLDGFGRPGREVDRDDPAVRAVYDRIRAGMMPAMARMRKIAG